MSEWSFDNGGMLSENIDLRGEPIAEAAPHFLEGAESQRFALETARFAQNFPRRESPLTLTIAKLEPESRALYILNFGVLLRGNRSRRRKFAFGGVDGAFQRGERSLPGNDILISLPINFTLGLR